MADLAESLQAVLEQLTQGQAGIERAGEIARERFGFSVRQAASRKKITFLEQVAIFGRDKYRCRYFGDRLVFPGVLLLLEKQLKEYFPAHKYYRVAESHWIYWMLWPVVDHVEAVASGVVDQKHPSNLVTTSTFRNVQKGHWPIERMGWHDRGVPGSDDTWDGMTGWFRDYMNQVDPSVWEHRNLRSWARAIGMGPPVSTAKSLSAPLRSILDKDS